MNFVIRFIAEHQLALGRAIALLLDEVMGSRTADSEAYQNLETAQRRLANVLNGKQP